MENIDTKSNHSIFVINQEPDGQFRWAISESLATFEKNEKRQLNKRGVIKTSRDQPISKNLINLADQLKTVFYSEAQNHSCPQVLKLEGSLIHDDRMELALLYGLIASSGAIQYSKAWTQQGSSCHNAEIAITAPMSTDELMKETQDEQDDDVFLWVDPGLQSCNEISSHNDAAPL